MSYRLNLLIATLPYLYLLWFPILFGLDFSSFVKFKWHLQVRIDDPTLLNCKEKNEPTVEIEMVEVEGGSFAMGCLLERKSYCFVDEWPVHEVTLADFKIGKYEVTQAQWKAVMGEMGPKMNACDLCPVSNVSWLEVKNFIKSLNEKTGKTYRLPSEAEWEYAAKGGQKSKGFFYSGSNTINHVGWCKGNSQGIASPVGQKQGNELGLFDMSGNVFEWCEDTYQYNSYSIAMKGESGKAQDVGPYIIIRGGGYNSPAIGCRITDRSQGTPGSSLPFVGFRLAMN